MAKKKTPTKPAKSEWTVNWFEIPAKDVSRAAKFYQAVLGHKCNIMEFGPAKMAMFPAGDGALVQNKDRTPSKKGALIYFDASPDLSVALARVKKAGGKVIEPKF